MNSHKALHQGLDKSSSKGLLVRGYESAFKDFLANAAEQFHSVKRKNALWLIIGTIHFFSTLSRLNA